MTNVSNAIKFAVMSQEEDTATKKLTCVFVYPANFGRNGSYDIYFDQEIADALEEFGLHEVREGEFNYENDESFNSQKLIDFLAERGIAAAEDEVPEDALKLTEEEQEYLRNYLSQFDDLINEYIDNPNKPNECIDLGVVKDETEARMKATEIMQERCPDLPKAAIYTDIFMPDGEDYLPEDGVPSFIYTIIHKTRLEGEKLEKCVVCYIP